LARRGATAEQTDWLQILVFYDVLTRAASGPIVTLSRAGSPASPASPTRPLFRVFGLPEHD